MVHGAVRGIAAGKVPSLDGAGKTLALAHTCDVDQFTGSKAVDQNAIASLAVRIGKTRLIDNTFLGTKEAFEAWCAVG